MSVANAKQMQAKFKLLNAFGFKKSKLSSPAWDRVAPPLSRNTAKRFLRWRIVLSSTWDLQNRRLKHLIRQGKELVMKRRRSRILVRRPVLNLYSFLLHLHSSNRDPAYRIVVRVLTSNRNISIFAFVTTKTKKVATFVPLRRDRKSRASMP